MSFYTHFTLKTVVILATVNPLFYLCYYFIMIKLNERFLMRLTLSDDEVLQLIELTSTRPTLQTTLRNQFKAHTSQDKSKKVQSIKEARECRTKATQQRILNAKNILHLEDKEITAYQIAKISGCSYNTVKKYLRVANER